MLVGHLFLFLILFFPAPADAQEYTPEYIRELTSRGNQAKQNSRDSGMVYYRMALSVADSLSIESREIALILDELANYDYYRGSTEKAITYALRAENIYRGLQDDQNEIRMMILSGDILRGNRLFQQSKEYLEKALDRTRVTGDCTLMGRVYNRLAALSLDDTLIPYDSVERYARISLDLAQRKHDLLYIYNNLNILGVLETYRKNYSHSLRLLDDALKMVKETYPEDEPLILLNMARNYYLLGKPEQAVKLDKKALELSQKYQIPQYVRLCTANLKDYYRSIGDYKQSLAYATLYYQAKEIILNQQVMMSLREVRNVKAIQQQQEENQRLRYEQQLATAQLHSAIFIGVLLLLILIGILLFVLRLNRQRKHIKHIAQQLDQSHQTLQRFIAILGHDLRSPFNAILGFSDLLKHDEDLSDQDKQVAVDRMYDVSRSTYRLLERILDWSRIQTGRVKPVKQACDLVELVRETISSVEPAALVKNISIHFQSAERKGALMADPDMLLTVFRNILSNAIKFTMPKGNVYVTILSDHLFWQVVFRDTGVGISREDISRLFSVDHDSKSVGTAGEPGSGLGLVLAGEYANMNGWIINVESEPEKGSTFTVKIPK